ncbi:MAG: hypothetical protein K2G52_06560 [Muribaculaceae bacterium]|nr:hypothetical protein [Muribaculaceae bacterium]
MSCILLLCFLNSYSIDLEHEFPFHDIFRGAEPLRVFHHRVPLPVPLDEVGDISGAFLDKLSVGIALGGDHGEGDLFAEIGDLTGFLEQPQPRRPVMLLL